MPEINGESPENSANFPVKLAAAVRNVQVSSGCLRVTYATKAHFDAIQQGPEIALHIALKVLAG